MKKATTTPISTLVEEGLLMEEIFTRSTVKSVGRCKCVCKLWFNLLSDPRFPKLHLNKSNSRNPFLMNITTPTINPPNTIPESTSKPMFHSIDCESLNQAITLKPKLSEVSEMSIVGSCNGLICLSDMFSMFSIWNPVLDECINVPIDKNYDPGWYRDLWSVMGFGYSLVSDEYKVVRVDAVCQVYTLRANSSWRVINGGHDLPHTYCMAVNVNGVLHWVEITRGYTMSRPIICFDLGKETFGEVPWPDYNKLCHHRRLGMLNGCLAVFCYDFIRGVDVHVMEEYGVEESWIKLCSIPEPSGPQRFFEPLVCRKDGEIVVQVAYMGFLVYDPVSQWSRVPVVRGIRGKFMTAAYEESLVSVDSLMAGNSGKNQQ